ncbi:MAG: hypothetical protein LUC44_08855 [Prevotellaceae bacterium]|nr:hypothetical protein [Prevotellaceae bacterium]
MNCTSYVFASIRGVYSQYPNDYTKPLFHKFLELSSANSQIIMHRNEGLVYHGYVRKLEGGLSYIGFCVVLNGAMFARTKQMFPVFEKVLTSMAETYGLLALNDKGDVIPSFSEFTEHQKKVENIIVDINKNIEASVTDRDLKAILRETYTNTSVEYKIFPAEEKAEDIFEAVKLYGYVCVTNDKHYVSTFLANYQKEIETYVAKVKEIEKEYSELKEKYDKQDAQNKVSAIIKGLSKIVITAGICLCAVLLFIRLEDKITLEKTKTELNDAQSSIESQNETIAGLRDKVTNLQEDVNNLQEDVKSEQKRTTEAESEYADFKRYVGRYMPVVITDVKIGNVYKDGDIETDYGNHIKSNSTMFLQPQITYTGIITDVSITVYIRLYTPSGKMSKVDSQRDYSTSDSFYVNSGDSNTITLVGLRNASQGYWSKGDYRYEIWYGKVCLYAKTFTIY